MLMVSHDLAVIAHLCERIGVRVGVALGHAVRLFDVDGVRVCVSQLLHVGVGEPV